MSGVVDLLAGAYASFPLVFWVLGSMALYVLGSHVLWLLRPLDLRRAPAVWRAHAGRGLIQVARLGFYLAIPYLALGGWPLGPFQGLLSLADVGLVGFGGSWTVSRWLEAAGTGLGLGLLSLLVLALAWANASRWDGSLRLGFAPQPWWALLVDGLLLEVHWAFYRGALVVALGDLYTGVYWALSLVFLEWTLNPFWRRGWRRADRVAGQWLRAALALASALIFYLTRNLWVCLVVHLALTGAMRQIGHPRAAVPAAGSDTV